MSGILDAVRAGLAIAPIVKSNVPADLSSVGIEKGLPMRPISDMVLHMIKAPASDSTINPIGSIPVLFYAAPAFWIEGEERQTVFHHVFQMRKVISTHVLELNGHAQCIVTGDFAFNINS